jgi:hypothetical protein
MRQTFENLATRRTALMLLVAAAALLGYLAIVSPGTPTKATGALTQYVPGAPGNYPGIKDFTNHKCNKAQNKLFRAKQRLARANTPTEVDRAKRKVKKAKRKVKKACAPKT